MEVEASSLQQLSSDNTVFVTTYKASSVDSNSLVSYNTSIYIYRFFYPLLNNRMHIFIDKTNSGAKPLLNSSFAFCLSVSSLLRLSSMAPRRRPRYRYRD